MKEQAFRVQPVMIWSDRERAFGERPGMANGLLYIPAGHALGEPGRAVLFAHRWGGYHYDAFPRALGPALAESSMALLSFALRRRGLEGPFGATPDDDVEDLKLALDYLASVGFRDVVLAGEGVGGMSVCRYAAIRPDLRVAGVALIRPTHDLNQRMQEWLGPEEYDAVLADAVLALRLGVAHDHLIDVTFVDEDGRPARVSQNADRWLAWWGPTADTRLSRLVERVLRPLLIVGAGEAWSATLEAAAASRQVTVSSEAADGAAAEAVAAWAGDILPHSVGGPLPFETVTADTADGSNLAGFLWTPPDGDSDTVVMYVHGMTSTPLRSVPMLQAPVYARAGWSTLSIEMRRSGLYGHSIGTTEMDVEDMEAFIQLLVGRGYRRVIPCGHSLGSISTTMHQALRPNPAVVAHVHMAPTAETADWARRGMGDAKYRAAVQRAREAVGAGRGHEVLIREDYRSPHPDRHHRLGRHYQTARSWLSWWGPDSIATHVEHISKVDVPIMLLVGSLDQYSDKARMDELEAAAIRAPAVFNKIYEGCSHFFGGFEQTVASDVVDWLSGRIQGGGPPVTSDVVRRRRRQGSSREIM